MKTKVGKLDSKHPAFREGYEYGGVCECGYFSFGWPLKKQAQMRLDAHKNEHETGEEMPSKDEVEAITPDKFKAPAPVDAGGISDDVWNAVK